MDESVIRNRVFADSGIFLINLKLITQILFSYLLINKCKLFNN